MVTLDEQIAALEYGEHLCMIYDSRAEQMAAAVPFISGGLSAGDRCVYVADDRTIEEVTVALCDAGLDVQAERDRGALLLLTKQDAYLRTGEFDPAGMIDFLRDAVRSAAADGFAGFRVTGEMTWALGPETGCDRIIEYEALLNEFFPDSRALAICQYNRERFAPAVIHDVLRTHPRAVLGRQVCNNLYYEPPELILNGEHEARRVDWMIGQLKRREEEQSSRLQMEAALRLSEQRFSRFMRHLPGLAWIDEPESPAPLVEGCVAWLACRLLPEPHIQQTYDLFLGEIVGAWADERVYSAGRWHFEGHDALRTLHHVAGGHYLLPGKSVDGGSAG